MLAQANREHAATEAEAAASRREVAALTEQVSALRRDLGVLQALLDDAETQGAEADVRIEELGGQLNRAIARAAAAERARAELEAAERARLEAEAERLERFQSSFMAGVAEAVGDREGVRVEGDRFVFSSEVLFPPGSAILSPEGREQVRRVTLLLSEIAAGIPPGVDWVLRVDGHTDDRPLSGRGRYRDNWELSQARALAVVRFMTDQLAFPPERLLPAGFGEYRPLDPATTPEARARNRRIELKLTER